MDISYFDLHQANFEVRYDQAYLLWDRAGAIWQVMRRTNPNLKLKEAGPAKVVMTLDDRFQLSVELDKLAVSVFTPPSNIDDYIPLCQQVLSLAINNLELTLFSRIGMRVIYRHEFRSRAEASDALISTKIMKVPEGKHFGIEGQAKLPHYAIRWEGDKLGVQVNLRAQERKILVEAIMGETAVQGIEKDLYELIFDVDYFTIGTVEVGQFRASDWITNALRVIRRDSKVFMEA
jgi:hypothetical protein